MRNFTMALLLGFGLTACVKGGGGGDDTDADTAPISTDDSAGGGDDTAIPEYSATLSGTVSVQLYDLDEDGEREMVSWDDVGSFPFGGIWVTAYQDDGTGVEVYLGSDAVLSPSTTGDAYSIDVTVEGAQDLELYARLDYHADRILGSSEPIGIYPETVTISGDGAVGDLDITILAYYDADGSDGGGSGGGGGGCSSAVEISGDLLITTSYAGGEGVVMLNDTSGSGPYAADIVNPTSNGSGADAAYGLSVCAGAGDYQLVGAWDKDGDLLFTPADAWGAYITSPDTDGNPITIGSADLSGYDVQVPLGDGESPFGVVPFVSISGSVEVLDGVFDDLPVGSDVYVAALKYRPTSDISAASLAEGAYDVETVAWADLSGTTSQAYKLRVPANTLVYLWAYADTDGDGLLNEPGEYVASGGTAGTGAFPVGSSSSTGNTLSLTTP